MLWLALHFPHLPLEIFSTGQTSTQQAFVVLEQRRIFLANEAACAQGIEVGTTLTTAHSIYPELAHKHRHTYAEASRLHELANTLYRFSGHISVQAPDCVLLEIGGSLKLFGCHEEIMQSAVTLCEALGHKAIARTARTPWSAIALARTQQNNLMTVPLKNAGLELAGVPNNIVERFANMGIYTLGSLLELPNKALGKRFGKALLKYLDQLTGDMPDPRKAITLTPNFKQSRHLLNPVINKGDLHTHTNSPMAQLAHALQHWLISHQLGCETLQWQFLSHRASSHSSNGDADNTKTSQQLSVRFATAKQSAADFLRISQLKLEQSELPEEILTIALRAKHLRPWIASNQRLFKTLPYPDEDSLSGSTFPHAEAGEIIDELNARLGDNTCQGIQSHAQHTPEHAWQAVSSHHLSHRRTHNQGQGKGKVGKRPLWLFDPPRQVHRSELELIQGPERIQSQWWSKQSVCRDYYIAQHHFGAECWTFVNIDDVTNPIDTDSTIDNKAEWFLHGYFG